MRFVLFALALMQTALLGAAIDYYSFDGTGNNKAHPEWGSNGHELQRMRVKTVDYADGISEPKVAGRPNARAISMALSQPLGRHKKRNPRHITDMITYIGQFFDHDIDLTKGNGVESFDIDIPAGDEYYDPENTGTVKMGLSRSNYNTSRPATDVRQQVNQVTAYIDGSTVYGSDFDTADRLRSHRDGRLLTHDNDMLPYATAQLGISMAADSGKETVVRAAGDFRANVNPPILALHTLFMREHNRLAGEIKAKNPSWDDEMIYQEARKWNVAFLQAVCFNEYLPMLGFQLPPYTGYKTQVDPSVDNFFSTVSYRYGHSEVGDVILRLDENGNEIPEGHLPLFDVFFHPTKSLNAGIEPVLRGLAWRQQMDVDTVFGSSIQHYLFGDPGNGGTDLSARNIQRARDHGLPGYNTCRQDFNLAKKLTFDQITSDPHLAMKLQEVYGSVDDIDPYIGGLAEDHVMESNLGELFYESLLDQYTRLRDGDRFFYQNTANGLFTNQEIASITATGLRDVILRNTNIKSLPSNLYLREPGDAWPTSSS